MPLRDLAHLLFLSVLFGSSFLFVRVIVPVFGPFFLTGARVLLAAGALALFARATGQPLRFGGRRRDWLLVGALNAAVPYSLLAFAQLHVTASLAAIFMATIPLFTAVVSAIRLGEKLTPKTVLGLLLGLAGVAVLSGWGGLDLTPVTLLALAAMLLAALSYALGLIATSLRFKDTPPLTVAVGNFLAAGVLLLPFALAAPPWQPPSLRAALALLAFILVPTALALVLNFHLLKRLGPTRLSVVAYLIPVSGALLGVVLLAEPVSVTMLVGFALVLLSVALVTDVRLELKKLRERRA